MGSASFVWDLGVRWLGTRVWGVRFRVWGFGAAI